MGGKGNIRVKEPKVSGVHWKWVRGGKYNFSLIYVKFEILLRNLSGEPSRQLDRRAWSSKEKSELEYKFSSC